MMHALGRKSLAAVSLGAAHAIAVARSNLQEGADPLAQSSQTVYILVSILLVIFSGICAGLTLGLLSLDRVDIEIYKRSGDFKEEWLAKRVEPLLSNPHHLLCALLLCNSACMEALPIFLDRLLNPVAAILISVSAILIFGEILPQAVCKRYGLQVGAYLSWLVRIMLIVTAPISWPLGKLIDWMLGEETVLFRRQELRTLVTLHAEPEDSGGESMLTPEEVTVIHGAMDMADKTAISAMTPLGNVFALPTEAVLDRPLMKRIMEKGHSRVPVYKGSDMKDMVGLLLVKEQNLVNLDEGKKVGECALRELDYLSADTPLYAVMEYFRLKRRHMAAITRAAPTRSLSIGTISHSNSSELGAALEGEVPEIIGLITIEDVLEELLQREIVDETDRFVDNLQTQAVGRAAPLSPQLNRYLTRSRSQGAFRRQPSGTMAAAAVGAAYAAARAARIADGGEPCS